MLQITILHEEKTVKILEIKSMDTLQILATFDEEKKMIDLEAIKDRVGEAVMVSHFNRVNDCTMFDYEHMKTITAVDQDENGLWYVEYN